MGVSRTLNKDGTSNVQSRHRPHTFWKDLYFRLITMPAPRFVGLLTSIYLLANCGFAVLYAAMGPDAISGIQEPELSSRFLKTFFFSVQTLATIGYGLYAPVTPLANLLVCVESLVGILLVATMTGLIFARFSIPKAKVRFSATAVISEFDGIPTLSFRVANARLNQIVDARVSVFAIMDFVSKEGFAYRDFFELKLDRAATPVFSMSWLVSHELMQGSPLHGLSLAQMRERGLELIVTLSGFDGSLFQPIYAKTSYLPEEIQIGFTFGDMIHSDETTQNWVVDLKDLDRTVPLQRAQT